jgi:DNA repair protein RadD
LAAYMAKPSITGNAITYYETFAARGESAVAFCISLQHAESVACAFVAAGWRAARIDGEMQRAQRRALVERFKAGEMDVLTSCELISEGFDLPAMECAILLRPTMSLGLHLQQIGRVLRPYPGKEQAIILDHAGNTMRHGMPDEPREWSLDGRPKSTRKALEQAQCIKTCPKCFAASRPSAPCCPYCGAAFIVKPREVEQKDGELVEVDRVALKERRMERVRAQTLDELVALGKARGYKNPGWWAKRVHEGRR